MATVGMTAVTAAATAAATAVVMATTDILILFSHLRSECGGQKVSWWVWLAPAPPRVCRVWALDSPKAELEARLYLRLRL